MTRRSVFDLGFHDGGDTEYYLHLGMNVVAVDANPDLVAAGRQRFADPIKSGQLTLHHAAVVAEKTLPSIEIYINHRDSGSSSGRRDWRADDCHAVAVPCITLSELVSSYGVPWYLKSDIEGMDDEVIASLPPEAAPDYLSCELSHPGRVLDTLVAFGYSDFKLINQKTFTQSCEIADSEIGMRGLRKLSTAVPAIRRVIQALPDSIRPRRYIWDSFREQFPYRFPEYSSGPCCEDTFGPWHSASNVRQSIERINLTEGIWFDLHARHPRHKEKAGKSLAAAGR